MLADSNHSKALRPSEPKTEQVRPSLNSQSQNNKTEMAEETSLQPKKDPSTKQKAQQTLDILRQQLTKNNTPAESNNQDDVVVHSRWVAPDYENDDLDDDLGLPKMKQLKDIPDNEFIQEDDNLQTWHTSQLQASDSSLEWASTAYDSSRRRKSDFSSIPPVNPSSLLSWEQVKKLPIENKINPFPTTSSKSRLLTWSPRSTPLRTNRQLVLGSVEDWFIPEAELETSKVGQSMFRVKSAMSEKHRRSRKILEQIKDILLPVYEGEDLDMIGGNSLVRLAMEATDRKESHQSPPEEKQERQPTEHEATMELFNEEDEDQPKVSATHAQNEASLLSQEILLKTKIVPRDQMNTPTTLQEEDEDRANSTEIRRSFQGIRTASNTVEIAKDLLQKINKMKLRSYVGFQTYRAALVVLSNLSRASTIDTLYETMICEGINVDYRMYTLIISVWCKRSLRKTLFYVNEMTKCELAIGINLLNNVIHAVCWAHDVPEDFKAGRAQLSLIHQLIALSSELSHITEETLLPLIRFANSFDEGLKVFETLKTRGCSITHKSIQAVLQLCISLGEPDRAEDFFQTMQYFDLTPQAPQWRALLRCYEASGNDKVILEKWDEMIQSGIIPTPQAYSILFGVFQRKVLASKPSDVEEVLQTVRQHFDLATTSHQYSHNMLVWNSALQIYADLYSSQPSDENQELGLNHLAKMKDVGLSANKRTKELYKQLTGLDMTNIDALGDVSDDKTLARYLRIRCRLGSRADQRNIRSTEKGSHLKQYLKLIKRALSEHDDHLKGPSTFTTLISLYGSVGQLELSEHYYLKVKSLFQTSKILATDYRSAVTAMMGAHTVKDSALGVINIWEEACALGIKPDSYMCTQLVWGLSKGGVSIEQQLLLVEKMLQVDIPLDVSAIIALLSSCACHADAIRVLDKFTGISPIFQDHPALLGAILKPCGRDKDLPSATTVFNRISKPRSRDWVELLNVCKECGDVTAFETHHEKMISFYKGDTDIPVADHPDSNVISNIAITCCYNAVKDSPSIGDDVSSVCLRLSKTALMELGTNASPSIIAIYKTVRRLCGEVLNLTARDIARITSVKKNPFK
eukprot:TRINITY_DN1472_c0_g1_i2.p1 TRINITY_DN1472_c0_g1~~TRINITY_DN1472_c0_g1_i2.p1  ORF type:complete len:1089 (+),score=196.95 TRINITY_DN1472_c0_g1_i2:946-4212(+)